MSEVLLINSPIWSPRAQLDYHAVSPPLGLAYLAACLLDAGISVTITDLNLGGNPDEQLKAVLERESPRLVGITSLTQNYFLALRMAQIAKTYRDDVFVVMGGPHVTYQWQETLAHQSVDAVVLFEGEQTLVELYRCLDHKPMDLSNIAGIAFKDAKEVYQTKIRPQEKNLDRIPMPARHLLNMASYRRPGTIMTSRGCPQKCIFCISSNYEGSYRPRSAKNVVEELTVLRHTWGIREMYFIDNVFTVDSTRVRDICNGIIQQRLDIRFHCVSRADLVTPELVEWLRAAGCERIEIGVETATQEIINALKKKITLEQVISAAEIVTQAGLRPMFTFQIGSPFETEDSLRRTNDLAAYLRTKGAITFFSIMTPFPGTPLRARAQKLGIDIRSNDWREYRTSNPVYDTQSLDRNRLRQALYEQIRMQIADVLNSENNGEILFS